MDEAEVLSARSYKHPLFAITIPLGFIWIVTAYLVAAVPALQRITPVYPLLYLLAALSETVVGNYLQSKKAAGLLPRLRELIVVVLFSFLFIKVTNGDVFRGDWKLARLDVALPMIFVAVEWILSYSVHAALRERELLLALVAGKERGELKESFRAMGTEAANSQAGMLRVRRLLVAFQVLAFAGLFFLALARPQSVSAGIVTLTLAHFAAGVIFFFTLTGYMERQSLMGEGFTVPRTIVGRRARFAAVLCVVAALLLIPTIGREAPLPSSYLQDFIEWLQRITSLPEMTRKVGDIEFGEQTPDTQLPDQRRITEALGSADRNNEALQRLIRTLLILLVAGVPAGVIIVLLVAPLFKKREEKIHPLKAIRLWLERTVRSLTAGLRSFAASLRNRSRRAAGRRSLRERLMGLTRPREEAQGDARAGFFQRLALSREIKTFVKIIRWGEKRGVRFRRSLGPLEYAQSLGANAPEVQGELVTVADILEELLFSGRGIEPQRSDRFFEAARLVLKYR